eukprot:s2762_g7.t1
MQGCKLHNIVAFVCHALLEHPRFLDIATLDVSGRTALHIAAQHGHADVCKVGALCGEIRSCHDSLETFAWLFVAYVMPSALEMRPETLLQLRGLMLVQPFRFSRSVNIVKLQSALHSSQN